MNPFRFLIPKSMVETVGDDVSVRQALEKMRFHRYTALPVLDKDGKYVGTVSDRDFLAYFLGAGSTDYRLAERDSVRSIMDPQANRPLAQDASMRDVLEEVKEHNFVPVVDDRGCFVGMILRREVLGYLVRYLPDDESQENEFEKHI